MLQLKSRIFFIFLPVLFFACKKEYSFEGSSPIVVAKYSLSGSPGVCTNALISGTYKTGVALSASNTVTIYADVAATGPYTISVPLQNGIRFSASGNFISLGNQAVTLSGTGTPLAAGSFDFSPGSNGCSFAINVANNIIGSSALFTYDGAPGPCTNISYDGNYKAGTALVASNNVKIDVNVTRPGNYTITTNALNGISFSGTGNFATFGYQVVTLTGSGTPVATGVFIFTPSNNGCPFAITVLP
jgi:hypothetical protein